LKTFENLSILEDIESFGKVLKILERFKAHTPGSMTFSTDIFHRTGLCHGCLGDHGLAGGFHSKSPSHRSGLGDQW
jgi:hypothetical protein